MRLQLVLALCALVCLSVRANPTDQKLRTLLEELETFVEDNKGGNQLRDVFRTLTGDAHLLKRSKPYDDYDPNAPLLGPDYIATLSAQDYADMDIEEIDDAALVQLEDEYTAVTQEIVQLKNQEPSDGAKREMQENDHLLKEKLKAVDDTLSTDVGKSRSKRFASAILFLITVGSNSYQIYNIATGGCGTFPSICDDKNAIESMTLEIETLKDTFDVQFQDGLIDYINLRDAMYDNDFILYYTNETINSVKNIDQMHIDIQDDLNARLPVLSASTANGSLTADQYLESVIGTFEMSMDQMNEMIQKTKDSGTMVVAINIGAQMLFSYMASSYQMAVNKYSVPADGRLSNIANMEASLSTKEKYILGIGDTADNVEYASTRAKLAAKVKGGFTSMSTWVGTQYKYTKRMFYNMATRPFVYVSTGIRTAGGLANYFSPRRAFNNFIGYTYRKFSSGLTTMRNGFQRLRSGQWRPFSTANFKFSWSTAFSFGLQAGLDVMASVMSYYDWKKVSVEMTKQRLIYENYVADLKDQQTVLDTDMTAMQTMWTEAIENFSDLSGAFAEIIVNGTEHSEVADATDIGFSYDLSNPIFSDNFFDGITKANLEAKANAAIAFISASKNDFFAAEEMLRGRVLFYNKVGADYEAEEPVTDITTITKAILAAQPSSQIVDFGDTLSDKDVVCYIAVVYNVDGSYYDYYELAPLLPTCDITDGQWSTMVTEANLRRYHQFMVHTVTAEVQSNVDVATILDTVQRDFLRQSDSDMQAYGAALTTKEIVCAIADITDAASYDFYALALYRDNACDAITSQQHQAVETAAAASRQMVTRVASDLNYCVSFQFCFCFDALAARYGVTDDDLKALMKAAEPGRTQYCGGAPMYNIVCSPACVDL